MKALNPASRRAVILSAGACLALFALETVLVNPLHNVPIGDDWEYAHSVQRLLADGQFYRSPMVQVSLFSHVLWGALFARVLGFSFVSLRFSTLVLAGVALVALYGILGELNFSPGQRLLGTLTMMVAPLFVFYAHSFNTEVPFLGWLLLGLWCTLRGLRSGRLEGRSGLGWIAAGSVFAALAFLTRQIGLALPLAAALVVVAYWPRARWPAGLAACLALPVLAAAGYFGWQVLGHQFSVADVSMTGQGTLQFVLNPQFPAAAARRMVLMLVTLALYMLPLWVAYLPRWRAGWQALLRLGAWSKAAGALLVLFLVSSVFYFGLRGDWWPYYEESLTRAGLGPSAALFAYPLGQRALLLPMPVWITLSFAGALLAGVLLLILLAGLRRVDWGPARWQSARQAIGPAGSLVTLTSLFLLAPVVLLPIIYARYFLPLLPAAIILLLEGGRRLHASARLATAGLLVATLLTLGLMRDSWSWREVRWDQSQMLVAHGVRLETLDAGYEWNGWHLAGEVYATYQLTSESAGADPWKAAIDPEYMVTFSGVPGYHVQAVWPFETPLRSSGMDRMLLLKRGAVAQ